ncbi:TRAP transporter small permease subunit [uncultured Oscillibacter sp.]|uniref:TRAP transporter small permease subunit n=1 Tax=uncultured Oscillibacter sp. TaxID=876091 RepID=UPI00260F86AC|nr:TRAP transporter small permease subunit [uncultured Oscillibacter sp.]
MKFLNALKKGLDTFGKYWALVIVVLFALPAFEALVMRYALHQPTDWSQELCCMIFGAYFMIGGAYGEACNAHVQMDLFYLKYRGVFKIMADTLSMLACTVFCWVLIEKGGSAFIKAADIGQRSDSLWAPYLWPVRLCIPLGSALLLVRSAISYIEKVRESLQYLRERKGTAGKKEEK